MKELYIIVGKEKRKAEKSICKNCNKEFLQRKNAKGTNKKIYCSKKCFYENKKCIEVELVCFNCKKKFKRKNYKLKNSKNKIYFCSRKCKDFSQSLEGKCLKIRPKHYGKVLNDYKKIIGKNIDKGCISCKENKKYLLTIHHIDGNKKNNNIKNLEVVCWNCHAKRHLKKVNEEWVFDGKFLTPRDLIEEL